MNRDLYGFNKRQYFRLKNNYGGAGDEGSEKGKDKKGKDKKGKDKKGKKIDTPVQEVKPNAVINIESLQLSNVNTPLYFKTDKLNEQQIIDRLDDYMKREFNIIDKFTYTNNFDQVEEVQSYINNILSLENAKSPYYKIMVDKLMANQHPELQALYERYDTVITTIDFKTKPKTMISAMTEIQNKIITNEKSKSMVEKGVEYGKKSLIKEGYNAQQITDIVCKPASQRELYKNTKGKDDRIPEEKIIDTLCDKIDQLEKNIQDYEKLMALEKELGPIIDSIQKIEKEFIVSNSIDMDRLIVSSDIGGEKGKVTEEKIEGMMQHILKKINSELKQWHDAKGDQEMYQLVYVASAEPFKHKEIGKTMPDTIKALLTKQSAEFTNCSGSYIGHDDKKKDFKKEIDGMIMLIKMPMQGPQVVAGPVEVAERPSVQMKVLKIIEAKKNIRLIKDDIFGLYRMLSILQFYDLPEMAIGEINGTKYHINKDSFDLIKQSCSDDKNPSSCNSFNNVVYIVDNLEEKEQDTISLSLFGTNITDKAFINDYFKAARIVDGKIVNVDENIIPGVLETNKQTLLGLQEKNDCYLKFLKIKDGVSVVFQIKRI
jgi:hypothetical protein